MPIRLDLHNNTSNISTTPGTGTIADKRLELLIKEEEKNRILADEHLQEEIDELVRLGARYLDISENENGSIDISLLNEKEEVLDTKRINVTKKLIKEVSLDYANARIIFTHYDNSITYCDISAITTAINNEVERAQAAEETLQSNITSLQNGKADKVASAVNGNLAGLDTNGNLIDSGVAANNVVTLTGEQTINGPKHFKTSSSPYNAYANLENIVTYEDDTILEKPTKIKAGGGNTYNIDAQPDWTNFGKIATFQSNVNVDGLIYAGGHEIRFNNDYLNFTDNYDQHNTIVQIHKDYVNFWRQATFLSNVKIADQGDTNRPLMYTTFNDGGGVVFDHWARINGAAEFNGLVWIGGREIRFPDYVEFKDNTEQHNTVLKIDQNYVNVEKVITLKQGANIDVQPTEAQHAVRKDYVDNKDSQLESNISAEESARISADQNLQYNIDAEASARESGDTTLQNNINTVDNKLNYNVHTEGNSDEITYDGDTVTKTSPYRNLKTGVTGSRTEVIHLANSTTAGLMAHADYNQIRNNTSRIEALEGQTKRLLYTDKTDPTAQEIQDFVDDYLEGTGITPSPEEYVSIGVVVSGTYHIWHYYNDDGWKDDGTDTVTQFTNSSPGVIQGKEADGFVYAENDGTGSVHGWDALKTRVTNVENTLDTSLSDVAYDTTNKKLTKTNNHGTTTDIVNLGLDTTTGSESITIGSDSLNVMTTDTAQTVPGVKTFSNGILFDTNVGIQKSGTAILIQNGNDVYPIQIYPSEVLFQRRPVPTSTNSIDLGSSTYKWKDLYLSGTAYIGNLIIQADNAGTPHFKNNVTSLLTFDQTVQTGVLRPTSNNTHNLGTSTFKWKDAYIAGNLSDGTNSTSIENIVTKTGNQTIEGQKIFNIKGFSTAFHAINNRNQELVIELDNGGGNGSGIFYDDDYLDSHRLYFPRTSGTIALTSDIQTDTSKYQTTSVVVGNAVTNINGRVFQNYTATLVTAGGYTFYQILKNGQNPTEEEAADYMQYMTGSRFVPKYNYDFPKQTIFTFADRSTWKPQYSANDGLRLYRLTTSLALQSDVDDGLALKANKVTPQESGEVIGGNLAGLNADGDLVNSGIAKTDVATQSGNNEFTGTNKFALTEDQTYYGVVTPVSTGFTIGTNAITNMLQCSAYRLEFFVNLNTGNIVPRITNNFDLGTSDLRYKKLYLADTAYIADIAMANSSKIYNNNFAINNGTTDVFKIDGVNGEIKTYYTMFPFSGTNASLGKSTNPFADLYLSGTAYIGSGSQITQSSDGSLQATLSGDGKAFKPSWDGHYNLGQAGYRWEDAYIAGNLSDGTNSITVANIQEKVQVKRYI